MAGALGMTGWAGSGNAGAGAVTGCLTGMKSGPFWPQPDNPNTRSDTNDKNAVLQTIGKRKGANMDFTMRITFRIAV